MKFKLARKSMAIFFMLCMILSLVPIPTFAAEGDTDITEVNINGVSNNLVSYEDVKFASIDESSNYTIESQKWYSDNAGEITPTSQYLKPTVKEKYSFIITLNAKDGYIFPIKSESGVFYNGIFKVNGTQCDDVATVVTSSGKKLTATLFPLTQVKGTADIPEGGNVEVKTSTRDNYTDCDVTDDINLKKDTDYIIDFTKDDSLSMALRSMADLEETKYYKFANDKQNSLIETENESEALIKIVGNKSENKAIMTTVNSIDTNTSYTLNFTRTQYTGSKLTYTGTTNDEETGKKIINEIRDDYYTRYHFNCKLNLITDTQQSNSIELVEINNATVNFKPGDKPVFTGKTPEGANYIYQCEWWETDDGKTGVNSEEFWNRNYESHVTSFESGKIYRYGLYLKADEGYFFTSNTKLKINGTFYNYKRSENDLELNHPDDMATMWVYTDLTLTPQASNAGVEYKVIEGADGSWIKNTDGTLSFRVDGDFSKFVGIKVDDSWVDSENYTAASGSTVVTLKNEYLKTLSEGNHKITFVYTDGEVSTNFEIKKEGTFGNSDNPKTGDNSNIFLWISLFLASFLGILVTSVYYKKKKSIV